jgi:hypothetical protein
VGVPSHNSMLVVLIDRWRIAERRVCILLRGSFVVVKNGKVPGYMYRPVCSGGP